MNMMPYYIFVRTETGWHPVRYYPKTGEYYFTGCEEPADADDFIEFGERVKMPEDVE